MQRWRGLRRLVEDAVEHGSRAVERVQKQTARWPFAVLEQIPPIAVPAKVVHLIYDASVTGVHGTIRLVNKAVGQGLELVIDAVEQGSPSSVKGGESKDSPDSP
jgi:hypothetical protein